MVVYIRACFCFALTGRSLTAQSMGATGELEVEFKFQRCSYKLSFLFLSCPQSAPERSLAGYVLTDFYIIFFALNIYPYLSLLETGGKHQEYV